MHLRRALPIAALCLAAIALRTWANNVEAYSPGDEAYYLAQVDRLSRDGLGAFSTLVDEHLARPDNWAFPPPLRWAYLGLGAFTCAIRQPCDARALAWLSTIASFFTVLFTWAIARRLLDRRGAIVALALSVASPLQLALGRRAWTDSLFVAAFLASFWAFLRVWPETASAPRRRDLALFVGLSALAFSVKEAFVFPFAAFAALFAIAPARRRRDLLWFLAAPAIAYLGLAFVSRRPFAVLALLEAGQASFLTRYTAEQQSGPPHRVWIDLLILAPIVAPLAAITVGALTARAATSERQRTEERPLRAIALFSAILLLAWAGLPKNARFAAPIEPLLRIFAAWMLVRGWRLGPAWLLAACAAILASDFALFHRVFIAERTYDPTTHNLLRALGAVPRPDAHAAPSAWPLVFFAALPVAVAGLLFLKGHPVTEPAEPKSEGAPEPTQDDRDASRAPDAPSAAPQQDTKTTEIQGKSSRNGAIVLAVAVLAFAFYLGRITAPAPGGAAQAPDATSADPAADLMSRGLAEKNPSDAVTWFQKVLQQNPNHYGATFQLARALDRAGRADEATAQWQRVRALAEQAKDAALIDMANKRLAGAAANGADPMTEGLNALYKSQDPKTAAERFREVLTKEPNHYGATYQLAVALDRLGDLAGARLAWTRVKLLAEAVNDAPSIAKATSRLAEIEKALQPPDPEAERMSQGIEALYTKKDPEAAAAIFRKILETNKAHYGASYQLAIALDQGGHADQARPAWERVKTLAEEAKDARTLEMAKARLAKKP